MAFIEVKKGDEPWERRAKRVLLTGPPNAGKTTSLLTIARTLNKPIAYLSYPGEAGASSLDISALPEGSRCWVWEDADLSEGADWAKVLREIKVLTAEIISKKHGTFAGFFGDGLHKLYGSFLAAQTAGASETGGDFEAKLYSGSHKGFFNYLTRVKQSDFDTVAFTVWDGREKDDPDAKDRDTQNHIFPELPGKAAKLIMGEFSVVLYATVQGVGGGAKYQWQTRPMGKVWGCGIKGPVRITEKIDTFIPQDWGRLLPKLLPTNQGVSK